MKSKRGQVTIFIIIGLIIVAGVVAYFLLRNNLPSASVQIPQDFQPAYNSFLSCLQSNTATGINVLESQGGYIYLPPFQPGSDYQPFSSDLVFMGNPIPYWYYISGNNIPRHQVPNVTFMQSQLAQFIDSKIRNCNLDNYTEFRITKGIPTSSVTIQPDKVLVNLNMDFTLVKGNQTVIIRNHKISVNSELGNLFDSAKKVYDYEQSSQFLENYTIDVLRNYAPVTGIDFKCSPETWSASSIFNTLKNAITDNIMSIRTGANKTNYFTINLNVNDLSFLTNSNWSSDYEVNPTEGDILLAQPIGNQQGLGILGLCYVPYHFVYSIKYPVLAVIRSGNEIFQFPLAVAVENNMPRGYSTNGTAQQVAQDTLCSQGQTNVTVNVFDSNSNPVNANISYECFGQTCNVGETTSGSINGSFPQCVNGYIIASANGFKQSKYLFSTVQTGKVNLVLEKVYNKMVNLEVDGEPYSGNAIVSFSSNDGSSQTLVYPKQKTVNLSEGDYAINAYVYENSSITMGTETSQQCVNIPTGISGISGVLQTQQCFNVNVPSQVYSNALSGGGETEYYMIDSELENSKVISINIPSLPKPTTLEQLQTNYVLLGNKSLTVNFE